MSDQAPDLIGEVVGWRAWRVIGSKQLPMLASVVARNFIWSPQRWTSAACEGCSHCTRFPESVDNDQCIPGEHCSCGLYAAASREQLVGSLGYNQYADDLNPVFIGEVGLVGKVIPGTQGWRAEKGRIRKLYVPFHLVDYVEPLERLYRVPVLLDNTWKKTASLEGRL